MTEKIKIRPIQKNDCRQVAELHKTNINIGFLSLLGVPFIKLIYQSMVGSDAAFCIVAESDNKIVGFVSGAMNLSAFYKKFARDNFFKASLLLLPKMLKPNNFKKIYDVLFYPDKTHDLPDAEFLSLVVEERYRTKGVALKLLSALINDFKVKGINKFKQLVALKLPHFNKFYEVMGATFHSDRTIYKDEKWRVYIWEI